jgi:predicted ester cyclase
VAAKGAEVTASVKDAVLEKLRRPVTVEEYEAVRQEWKTHSIAEDKRDITGLLSTLTPDCVYELVNTGHTWRGHAGAASFYQDLLAAFPDIHFDLTDIVIGPQGVSEEAAVTATHRGDWLDFKATGRRVEFRIVIFFPWDRTRRKFSGEKVYLYDADAVLKHA